MTHCLKNYRNNYKKQNGVTLLGLMLVSVVVIVFALVGMKVVPAYMEFLSVKKVLSTMKQEPLAEMSDKDIRTSFDKRASIAYISVVKGSDLIIEKNGDKKELVMEYQVIKPIAGNISVLIDFSTR